MKRLTWLLAGGLLGWLGAELRYGHHFQGPPERDAQDAETPEEAKRRERGFASQTAVRPEIPDYRSGPGLLDGERPPGKHRG